jgi:dCMP deaminase
VIVDANNRIVATGYNGPPAGFEHGNQPCTRWCARGHDGPTVATARSYVDCPNLHAEANVLMVCDREARLGGTMYVTSGLCFTCAKLVANSGLRVVVIVAEHREYRREGESVEFLRHCGIDVVELVA